MTWKALAGAILLAAAPLASAAQPAADPSGDWTASLKLGAVSLRTALHLGAAASSFDSPDQGVRGLPARMTSEGRHVVVAIEKVGRFEGDLSTDGQTLTGRLGQGSVSYPLVFTPWVFRCAAPSADASGTLSLSSRGDRLRQFSPAGSAPGRDSDRPERGWTLPRCDPDHRVGRP